MACLHTRFHNASHRSSLVISIIHNVKMFMMPKQFHYLQTWAAQQNPITIHSFRCLLIGTNVTLNSESVCHKKLKICMMFRWLPMPQCESLGYRVDKWGVGTQLPAWTGDLSPSRLISDGYCGPLSIGHVPNHSPTPPIHHIRSWHAQGQICLYTFNSKTVPITQFRILCLSAQHNI
jgi:hypothetical protein